MKILVLNCGSSSLKYQMYDMTNEEVIAKGLVERIGIEGSRLEHKPVGKDEYEIETEIKDHEVGIKLVLDALVNENHGVISSLDEINAVGHRVVHGGDKFIDSVLINEEVKKKLEELIEIAPLHNPPALMGIKGCEKLLPEVPQVAVFDTAFHQTMPAKSYTYALPHEICEKHNIRRYGFHGTSHKFVTKRLFEITDLDKDNSKVITCHLGNGASVCAIKDGEVVDTSMGLTPLEGLVMGTRSGSIDPAIVTYMMDKEGLSTDEVNNILNKKSGVLGISGVSSDFRDLEKAAEEGNDKAQLALDVFIHYVKKTIGSYAAVLNGVDAIVFTAGLGENSKTIREKICEDMDYLGVEIDQEKNDFRGEERDISSKNAKAKAIVIPTNEELMIARDTQNLSK